MTSPSFAKLKVGYSPYSADLGGPGDRRRFCRYAALRGIDFEIVRKGARYDLVVLSSLADITHWSRAGDEAKKMIFDLPDSYLHIGRFEPKALLRGTVKYLLRQHEHLEWSYHDSIARICARADAVLCSTPEQRAQLLPFSSNVHAILDFHTAAVREVKRDFRVGDTAHLLWEGQAGNLFTFEEIAESLRTLASRRRVALHLITDIEYKPFNGPVPKVSTRRAVESVLRGIPTYLYEWNDGMFAAISTRCDLGLIPMVSQPIFRAKAENKLLLLWRMGIPTITADTPAYVRTMAQAGVPMTCSSPAEWLETIERYLGDERLRREAAEAGQRHAETEHGEAAVLERWDALMRSVLT